MCLKTNKKAKVVEPGEQDKVRGKGDEVGGAVGADGAEPWGP